MKGDLKMGKITIKDRNDKRMKYYELVKKFFEELGEDIDFCAKGDTNTAILNFPTVINEEDAWVEVMVSIPTKADYDGYEQREAYSIKLAEKAEKRKEAEEKKKKKIERDKKLREEKERKRKEKEA